MMKSKLLVMAAVATMSSAAMAEGVYVSMDYSLLDTEVSADWTSQTESADPTGLLVALGNQFNENFAVEAQVGVGLSEDEFVGDWEIELSRLLALNVVGILPVNDSLSFYGKAGLMKLEFEDSDDDKYDDTGISYGIGAQLNLSSQAALKVEYVVLPDTENDEFELDIESNAINLGLKFQF